MYLLLHNRIALKEKCQPSYCPGPLARTKEMMQPRLIVIHLDVISLVARACQFLCCVKLCLWHVRLQG